MGYFSNGTEGEMYEDQYCERCVHSKGCTVWDLHMLYNYYDCDNKDSYLHMLIPVDGTFKNLECKMFYKKAEYRW